MPSCTVETEEEPPAGEELPPEAPADVDAGVPLSAAPVRAFFTALIIPFEL